MARASSSASSAFLRSLARTVRTALGGNSSWVRPSSKWPVFPLRVPRHVFEEKWDTGCPALVTACGDPIFVERPSSWAALPAGDHPLPTVRAFSTGEIMVHVERQRVGWIVGGKIVVIAKVADPFLTQMKAAAAFAAGNNESAVFFATAGGSVPDFQGDTVLLGGATVAVENLAAGGIAASENQGLHCHFNQPSHPIKKRRFVEIHGQVEQSSLL